MSTKSFKSDSNKKQLEVTGSMKDCILKATKPKENPIKSKHSRKVVLLAFKENGVQEFWANCAGRPGALSYWKYFQLFHMIVKENHSTVLRDSHRFTGFIQQQGLCWYSLEPPSKYGHLLRSYTQVLLMKMEFHYTNPNLPGSLEIDDGAFLLLIDNSEPNYLLEMLQEILKYWSVIENFLSELLNEVPPPSKWSPEFQCRFEPFVLCIEEVQYLYKYSRSILYKLHTESPALNLQFTNASFMNKFETQVSICRKALCVNWLATATDLTFINNQNIPEAIIQSQKQNNGQRQEPLVELADVMISGQYSESNPTIQPRTSSLHSNNANSNTSPRTATGSEFGPPLPHSPLRPTALSCVPQLQSQVPQAPPSPSAPDYSAINTAGRGASAPELPPRNQQPASQAINDSNSVSALHSRIRYLEMESNQKSVALDLLLPMNKQLAEQNDHLFHTCEKLKAEMKELKINTGKQFCQLYAAVRERDERIKKLESS